jgi:surface antigen
MLSPARCLLLTLAAALALPAWAVNTLFLGNAPLARMTSEDVDIFHDAAVAALETGEDGKTTGWKNPTTKAWGRLTPLNRYESSAGQCRDLRIQNWAGGIAGAAATVTVCKSASGEWKAKSE